MARKFLIFCHERILGSSLAIVQYDNTFRVIRELGIIFKIGQKKLKFKVMTLDLL